MRLLVGTVAVVGLVNALAAPLACADEAWLKLKSAHFELYTTEGEKKGREALLYFEQVRDFFGKVKKVEQVVSSTPVRLIAFRSEGEYKPYRINEFGIAFYLDGYDRDYIVMRGLAPENYPTAVHEFTHLLVKHSGIEFPIWLNEGLAELYSTLKPIGKKVRVGEVIPGHYYRLQKNKWMSLETLTAVDHHSPYYNERDRAGIFYSESWALVHMLNLSAEYRPQFSKFVTLILSGVPAGNAFRQTYAKTSAQVQTDLEQYMRGTRFNAVMFDVKLEKSAEEPDVAPAPPLESGMVLADLLALTNKKSEAKEAYAKLGREFPRSWVVEAGLAELAWREKDIADARRHFARAAVLGATNPRIYFDYAVILRKAGEKDAALVPPLTKAVELDPDYEEAHRYLAFCLIEGGDYEGALYHLMKVKHVKVEEGFAYYHGLAFANYRLAKRDAAMKAAETARKFARTPEEIATAEEILRAATRETAPPGLKHAGARGQPSLTGRAGTAEQQAVQPRAAREAPEEERPKLARREEPPQEPAKGRVEEEKPRLSITGTLQQIDCLGKVERLRVLVGQKPVAVAITDPLMVSVKGSSTGTLDLTCGPQKGKTVVLEYDGRVDAKLGTVGVVRAIEFK